MKILILYNGVFLGKEQPYEGPPTFCLWPRKAAYDKGPEEFARKLSEFTGWEIVGLIQ